MRGPYIIILILIILVSIVSLGKTVDINVGPMFQGTNTYLQIQLMPIITLGNFEARLKINMGITYNATTGINPQILNKSFNDTFDYIRYNGDLFWDFNGKLNYGALNDVFVDYGLFTDRYSTMGEKGFFADLRWRNLTGITALFPLSSATATSLQALRVYIQPLSTLLIGGTYIMDTSTPASITAVGADIAMELVKNSGYLYLEWGKFLDYGWGVSTGILFRFGDGGLFRLMYRYDSDKFMGSYFDPTYELNKVDKRTQLENSITKQGILCELLYSNATSPIKFYLEYRDYMDTEPYLAGGMNLKIGTLSGNVSYIHRAIDFANFQLVDDNTLLTANAKFYITPFIYTTVNYEETYSYDLSKKEYLPNSNWSTAVGVEF